MSAPTLKRKFVAQLARILVSAALIVYVFSRMQLSDRPGIELTLMDGRVVAGTLLPSDGAVLEIQPRAGEPIRIPADRIVARREIVLEPGFLTLVAGIDKGLFLAFMMIWFIPVSINVHRWTVLLRVVGVEVRLRDVFRLSYVGIFFNNFMLGSTGGDLLKAYLVARDTEHKTRAVASIFVDRLLGMLGLALVAMGAIGLHLDRPELREAAYLVGGFLLCFLVGTLVYFDPYLRSRRWVVALLARLPFQRVRQELDIALHLYHSHKAAVAYAIGISLVSHLSVMIQGWGFMRAAGVEPVTLLHVCSYLPVIMILSALPISLGGLGVGETAYVHFFGPLGMSSTHAVMLSLVGRLANLALSLPGGLMFMGGARRREYEEARREVEREDAVAP